MTEVRPVPPITIAALRKTRLWRDAPEALVRDAAQALQSVRFAGGERLIRRGRPAERLIVVVSGRVEVRVRGVAGTVSTVAVLGDGECVGESSLLTGEPATADVVAADDVEALTMSAADFARVVRPAPELLQRFLRIAADRLSRTEFALALSRERDVRIEELLLEPTQGETELVGKSPAVRRLRERIAAVAPSELPVLVLGEEGTQRGLVGRLVHMASERRARPLLGADCAQIKEEPWGDRLFGSRDEGLVSRTAGLMEAAEGGTLLLREIELLPAGVQERLASFLAKRAANPYAAPGARIIATCGDAGDETSAGPAIVPALLAAFGDRRIRTPPLRERKRDIPELAEHLLRMHAARLNRAAKAFDDQAMTRLVSYDYRHANERELDQAIARAVILADGETVSAEEIFFGPPPAAHGGVDLLRLPWLGVRRFVAAVPTVGRAVSVAAFAILLYACFFDSDGELGKTAAVLAWSVGWPALAVSFLLVGRAACAVCPMGAAAAFASRRRPAGRSLPAWLKAHDWQIALAGFLAILVAEQSTGMRESPLLTGVLFASLLSGAVIFGLVYPRRTWCRHVCPLGRFAGVCATAGAIELRPSFDVCSARCVGHACFKGDEQTSGCPMFNHVMFVDSNQHCVLCMNCVRSCPNTSPRLNLRWPGRELWTGRAAGVELGSAVAAFGGMTAALCIIQAVEHAPEFPLRASLLDHHVAFVVGALLVGAALPLLALRIFRRSIEREDDAAATALSWRRIATLAPLVAAGFVAYQLAYVPELPRLRAVLAAESVGAEASTWTDLSLLGLARIVVLSAGLLTSMIALWQVDRAAHPSGEPLRSRWRRDAAFGALLVGYWAGLLGLLLVR